MAGIEHKEIRLTLRNQLDTVVGLPAAANRAWENRKFEPPTDTWIRETFLPNEEGLVANQLLEALGFVVYDVFHPEGEGTEDAEDLADDIVQAFVHGTTINGSVDVTIDRAERQPGSLESEWYMIPVRISWRAYAPRT